MINLLNGKYNFVLASKSPRRQALLKELGLKYSSRTIDNIDESFPDTVSGKDVAGYLSQKKSNEYRSSISDNELVITADTIVLHDDVVLGKPTSKEDAFDIISKLSASQHTVITGITLLTKQKQQTFSVETIVNFSPLSDDEINYYIETYKPFDKAGAYGIQEWIGLIGISSIEGSYYNVMGLPVQTLYRKLLEF